MMKDYYEILITLDNEEVSRESIVKEMISYYNELNNENKTKITDFNEGSEIRNLLESIATPLFKLMKAQDNDFRMTFLRWATGNWLDLKGEELQTPRDSGSASKGNLKFYFENPFNLDVEIPAGTIILQKGTGIRVATVSRATLLAGETEIIIPAYSWIMGKETNFERDTLVLFENSPPHSALKVTNPEPFIGGRGIESDDEYRERLLNLEKQDRFGSISWFQTLCDSIFSIHDIAFIAPPVGSNYTATCLVNGFTKPTPDEAMVDATALLTDQRNLIIGQKFITKLPVYITVNLTVQLYVVDETVPEQNIKDALSALFDGGTYGDIYSKGLSIGTELSRINIIHAIENVMGVDHVDYVFRNSGESFNVLYAEENEVFRLGTLDITQKKPV